jgi:translation initiation factor 2 beta subunit (eIF-2beta)/eIF-5
MIPDYVICLECETPCYTFEWREDKLIEALCTTCGSDDPSQFVTEEEYEEMAMDQRTVPERKV